MGSDDDLLIVQVCDFLDTGDVVYRFEAPSRALSRMPGVTAVDIDLHHRALPLLAELADVLVLGVFVPDMLPLIQRRRAAGRISVFEANDYYYDVQSWNPLSRHWLDRSVQDAFGHGLIHADGVQTSTQELSRRWRERTSRPIAVFENQLTDVAPPVPRPSRPLTIGWGGSPGHFADWYHIAPVLTRWLAAHPDAHLAVMTNEFARPFIDQPPDRYHFRRFGSLAAYMEFLGGIDIGVAPLLPSDYNRCRSDVKFLEYASAGVAGIYSDLEPYRTSVIDGRTGLLYRTEDELLRCLDRLAGDAQLRESIRHEAHAYVAGERRLEHHVGRRLEFYRSLLVKSHGGSIRNIPEDVLAIATCDGRYLRLPRQDAEKKLISAIGGKTTPQSVGVLKELTEQFPAYLPALQHLGRQQNDQRQHQAALESLERARLLDPASVRTACEIGRALYMLDKDQAAREVMESALTANPLYHVGWQYLLVMLQRAKAGEGLTWAQRAHAANPANYELALVGIRFYPRHAAIARLRELLDFYYPTLLPEETPAVAATFARGIAEAVHTMLGEPQTLSLLTHASDLFPASARLAGLHARALGLAGRQAESLAQYHRAQALRLAARTWQAEFPEEDGSIHFGQFAEHIQSLTRTAP